MAVLEAQLDDTLALLDDFSEAQSLHRYAPGKWSARELMCHVNDTERLFAFRAFWFARGLDSALPSFDEDAAVPMAGADERSWASHIEEFQAVRAATLTLFRSLPDDAWARRGIASGNPFTVRALAYICAGHVAHHVEVLKDRYR
ncbi:MAG: DinB family protein [Gemmatimonadaceae bacterium]